MISNMKNGNNYRKLLNKIILQLNSNEIPTGGRKIIHWCYQILLCVIFLFSILIAPILIGFIDFFPDNTQIITLLCIITYGSLVLVIIYGGFIRKKIIISRFYKIKKAHQNINLIKVEDLAFLDELYHNSALTFVADPAPELLDFIYNWLYNKHVLKKETVNLYILTGRHMKEKYKYRGLKDDISILCILLKDLDLNDENMMAFSREHFTVGARWFDDIIDNH